MNKKLIRTLTAGVLVLAIVFAGFSGLKAVFAQTTTPETPSTTVTPATPSTTGTEVLPGKGYQGLKATIVWLLPWVRPLQKCKLPARPLMI